MSGSGSDGLRRWLLRMTAESVLILVFKDSVLERPRIKGGWRTHLAEVGPGACAHERRVFTRRALGYGNRRVSGEAIELGPTRLGVDWRDGALGVAADRKSVV